MISRYNVVLLTVVISLLSSLPLTLSTRKDCDGSETLKYTNYGIDQYEHYRSMYENCTSVTHNLVISHLTGNPDLTIFSTITEVYGSVLILANNVSVIPLHNLTVIRGSTLYWDSAGNGISLMVAANEGLTELQMPALQEVRNGDVVFKNNKMLCFEQTINWAYILNRESAKPHFIHDSGYELSHTCSKVSAQQLKCDSSCTSEGKRFCWGVGPDQCQSLTSLSCSGCRNRCFGPLPGQCCDEECAGGCTGYLATDCLACRNFENEGKCESQCPPRQIQNRTNGRMQTNPEFKYSYKGHCLKTCGKLKIQDTFCVSQCGEEYKEIQAPDGSIVCQSCNGECPKGDKKCAIEENSHIDQSNLHLFENCTQVFGSIKINNITFIGGGGKLRVEDLEVLSSVREISGYLYVDSYIPELKSLSFLRNLRIIGGEKTYRLGQNDFALAIRETSLEYLGLESLQEIQKGNAAVVSNSKLCYMQGLNLKITFISPDQKTAINKNKNDAECISDNKICSEQCEGGCWGPGPDKCVRCKGFLFERTCLSECVMPGWNQTLYNTTDEKNKNLLICKRCHPECLAGCVGQAADQCVGCRNVMISSPDGVSCLPSCPLEMYANDSRVCQLCDESCREGCTGPLKSPGFGGCNKCRSRAVATANNSIECLPANATDCPPKHFYREEEFSVAFKNGTEEKKSTMVCRPCHPECKSCYGELNTQCKGDCVNLEQDGMCVSNCTNGFFKANETCQRCTTHDVGLAECAEILASLQEGRMISRKTITAAVFVSVFVIIIVIIVTVLVLSTRERRRKLKQKLLDEIPITSTEASPDLSALRLVEDSELKRGNKIGSGAFGTVFKGVWIPPKENLKIPVAIKVLTDSASSNLNVELLEEARVMASVKHQYCIRILAVCMSNPMQLVTPLMPLGCLLDYIQKNKNNIGSKALLTWSSQISRGMEYLESRGIVHRDLAARNVLVQSTNRVKITDFGLAKLLDYKEEEYRSCDGKMPIKWLALESLQHRTYTHKSDVWSYGVTLWELFTFGKRPYEDIPARSIPDALEKGVRLPQPDICTIDVYLLMIKCWMLDAYSRPSFSDLSMEFIKMAGDPGRYIVIQGDQFMRLQSQSSDSADLMRGLSDIEDLLQGPEQLVNGEDYLRPSGLDSTDGLFDDRQNEFNPLLSIPEEDGYLNSNFGKSVDSPPLKPGMTGANALREDYSGRYIPEPCGRPGSSNARPGPGPSNVRPGPTSTRPPPATEQNERGYMEPNLLNNSSLNYLEVKGSESTSPNFSEGQGGDLYLNTPGVNNPNYYSNNPSGHAEYLNMRKS